MGASKGLPSQAKLGRRPTIDSRPRSAPAPLAAVQRTGGVARGVVQAMFWEATPDNKYIWHWGPVIERWWRKAWDLDTGGQQMRQGYGVWERRSVSAGALTARPVAFTGAGEVRCITLRVGRRTAFFQGSPATHAVFELNGRIFGLAGDFNAVGLAEDRSDPSRIIWVSRVVHLSRHEAKEFYTAAEEVANSLSYNLFQQNCYTPVTSALLVMSECLEQQAPGTAQALRSLLQALSADNSSCGVVTSTADRAFVKTYKKNV